MDLSKYMIFSRHHKYLTQNLVGFCWNKNVSEYLAELKGVYRESQWCSGTDGRGWLVPSRAGSRQALAMPCDCRVGAAFTHSRMTVSSSTEFIATRVIWYTGGSWWEGQHPLFLNYSMSYYVPVRHTDCQFCFYIILYTN